MARSWLDGRLGLENAIAVAKANNDADEVKRAEEALARYPKSESDARNQWQREKAVEARAAPLLRHAEPFPGKDEAARGSARVNFLTLVFCLMVGTAALPHVLMRYYTTPSVRQARSSVAWSLFFILLLYVTAPALAVLVKYVIYHDVVGTPFANLPDWAQSEKPAIYC